MRPDCLKRIQAVVGEWPNRELVTGSKCGFLIHDF